MRTRFTVGALVDAAVSLSAAVLMTYAGYRMLADFVQGEAAIAAQAVLKHVA